jgi:hypothetical protein
VLLEDFHIRRAPGERRARRLWFLPRSRVRNAPPFGLRRPRRIFGRDGTLRTLRFLERMDCAILSSHRTIRPQASLAARPASSAQPGSAAATARSKSSPAPDQTVLEPGEAVIVRTPTGGGYGEPDGG